LPYQKSIEPNAKSDASTSKKNGFKESTWTRIEANVNAFLSTSKSFLAFSFHTNCPFL
jgi:hypothetical protein